MNDSELLKFAEQMIERFENISELQREFQYETMSTSFTEWELKRLTFALKALRDVIEREDKPCGR